MKVSLDVRGPDNSKFWNFDMEYHDLPEAYVGEVAGAASALASYVKNIKGNAGQLKAYSAKFKYQAEGRGAKGEAEATQLLYSQMVAIQKAGLQLMEKLLLGADMEIASGQRS